MGVVQQLRKTREEDLVGEVLPPSDVPKPPTFLKGLALKCWRELSEDLFNAGRLSHIDVPMFAAFCSAYGRYATAEIELNKIRESGADKDYVAGDLMKTKKGGYMVKHPLAIVSQQACEDMRKYAREFGMTPLSRSLMDSTAKSEDEPAARRYM